MPERTLLISAAKSNEPRKNLARSEGPVDGIPGPGRRRERGSSFALTPHRQTEAISRLFQKNWWSLASWREPSQMISCLIHSLGAERSGLSAAV